MQRAGRPDPPNPDWLVGGLEAATVRGTAEERGQRPAAPFAQASGTRVTESAAGAPDPGRRPPAPAGRIP